jgi:hypothetical protein
MRRILLLIGFILFGFSLWGQDTIPDSGVQPFYGVRYFVSMDAKDTAALHYNGDTLIIVTNDSLGYRFIKDNFIVSGNSDLRGQVKVDQDWLFQNETEGGLDRLTLTNAGANVASELFLHPTGSATTARLTVSDNVNTTNYDAIELEATDTANRINSTSEGTGTTRPLRLSIDDMPALTIETDRDILLKNGTIFNEFSTDENFTDSSTTTAVSESAIKAYVDANGGGTETDPVFKSSVRDSIYNYEQDSNLVRTSYSHFSNTSNPHQSTLQNVTDQGNSTPNFVQITGNNNQPTSGKGVELYATAGGDAGVIRAFDQSDNTYNQLTLYGDPVFVGVGNLQLDNELQVDGTGDSYFSGNVGIGTTTPTNQTNSSYNTLVIEDNAPFLILRSSLTSETELFHTSAGFYMRTRSAEPLRFGTDYTERMRIDATGNVGIGTTSPSEKLEVSGNIKADTAKLDIVNSVKMSDNIEFVENSQSTSGTVTFDLSTASVFELTMTGDVTLDYSNATTGTYIIVLKQDATGGRTVSWAASSWQASGGSVTIDSDANDYTVLSCFYNDMNSRMVITEIQNLSDL